MNQNSSIQIKRTNGNDKDFVFLTSLLDKELNVSDQKAFENCKQFNQIDMIEYAVLVYDQNIPVGCGAIRHYSDTCIEVKRMYVLPDKRKFGIASLILQELEKWGHELGYKAAILETGEKFFWAINLYQKAGYTIIPNYGQYEHIETSKCLKKDLSEDS